MTTRKKSINYRNTFKNTENLCTVKHQIVICNYATGASYSHYYFIPIRTVTEFMT